MSINKKLLSLFLASLLVCTFIVATTDKMVVKTEIREITRIYLQSIADAALHFVKINKTMEQKALEHILNKEIKIDETGFFFVIDSKGNLIVHKKAQGKNWISKPFIKYIAEKKTGYHRYLSPKTHTYKVAAFTYYPPKDWIIVASNFEDDALVKPLRNMTKRSSLISIPVILLIFFISLYFINRYITRPINAVVTSLKDIAEGEGDLTCRINSNSKDEMGSLANWFNVFVEKVQKLIMGISNHVDTLDNTSTGLSTASNNMFSTLQQVTEKSNTVAAAAEETSANMSSVSAASEEAATNLTMVSTAAQEMLETIRDISDNSNKGQQIVSEAVTQSQSASKKMSELGNAAVQIGRVTETITEISEQTNLLALNATIEAARAGEAGKGFAVVANEIKDLAKQTAEATQDIKIKITDIQDSTTGSVKEIKHISSIITEINEIVSTIVAAVEEQSAATHEITGNIAQASQGIEEVNENVAQSSTVSEDIAKDIADVNCATSEISGSSTQVKTNAEELSLLAEQLKAMVGKFKV